MNKRLFIKFAILTVGASALQGAGNGESGDLPDPPTAPSQTLALEVDPAERIKEIRDAVDRAEQFYLDNLRTPKREGYWSAFIATNDPAIPVLIKLAKEIPDSAAAFDTMEWILNNRRVRGGEASLRDSRLEVVGLLAAHHVENRNVGGICQLLKAREDWFNEDTMTFLRMVKDRNPERHVRGQASFALASMFMKKAEDMEGRPLSTRDFSGNVIVLTFWATWCGPCMNKIPAEKQLLESMQGKLFVMIGINGDSSLEKAWRAAEEEGINWRSLWDGVEGPRGDLSRAWNVRGWPTTYVIDSKGIIRYKIEGYGGRHSDEELKRIVSKLVDDAMQGQPIL